jgi:hypothetical protein
MNSERRMIMPSAPDLYARHAAEIADFTRRFGLTPDLGCWLREFPDGKILCLTDDGLNFVLGFYRNEVDFTRGEPIGLWCATSYDRLLTLARSWVPVAELEVGR